MSVPLGMWSFFFLGSISQGVLAYPAAQKCNSNGIEVGGKQNRCGYCIKATVCYPILFAGCGYLKRCLPK